MCACVCVCARGMCGHVCPGACMEVTEQHCRVVSLLPPFWVPEIRVRSLGLYSKHHLLPSVNAFLYFNSHKEVLGLSSCRHCFRIRNKLVGWFYSFCWLVVLYIYIMNFSRPQPLLSLLHFPSPPALFSQCASSCLQVFSVCGYWA